MSAELDMSQYLDLFLQEGEEQLEILEQQTLKLESDPTDDRLQVIFRAAHTLKGSSRAMGFANLAQLTHEMENVLDKLRNHTLAVNTLIADALLQCQDVLRQMIESIGAGNGDAVDCSELVQNLQALGGDGSPQSAPNPGTDTADFVGTKVPEAAFAALQEAAEQAPVYHAMFRLHPECVMKYVRAFMALNMVQECGEILVTVPEPEKLEEEEFEHDFELVFHYQGDVGALQAQFKALTELESVQFQNWSQPVPEQTPAVSKKPTEPVAEDSPPGPVNTANGVDGVGTGAAKKTDSGQTVRVDVTRLDNLMNLVGELVIDRTRIAQIGSDLASRFHDPNIDALTETVGHIARITGDLQDQIMKARMMPIETVFNRFPRVVRDLAQKLGKDIKLEIFGGDTELDRSVIEVIGDPLLHIIRNSIDHGIEMPEERAEVGKPRVGIVTVSARHQENHIVIEIVDDGGGIDVERVRKKALETGLITAEHAAKISEKETLHLIFESGLSTATEVSEVSGRGVGMDIVRSNIQKLGGIIDLESVLGKGTRFSLRLPLTLAIIRGLLVNVDENVYVLPLGSVVETLLVEQKDIQTVNTKEVIVIRGMTTPLIRLREALGAKKPLESSEKSLYVVIVGLAERRVGFVVDNLIGEHEVVIKSLSRFCGEVRGMSGATILGDGNVALIVDVNGIVPNERMEKAWH